MTKKLEEEFDLPPLKEALEEIEEVETKRSHNLMPGLFVLIKALLLTQADFEAGFLRPSKGPALGQLSF